MVYENHLLTGGKKLAAIQFACSLDRHLSLFLSLMVKLTCFTRSSRSSSEYLNLHQEIACDVLSHSYIRSHYMSSLLYSLDISIVG